MDFCWRNLPDHPIHQEKYTVQETTDDSSHFPVPSHRDVVPAEDNAEGPSLLVPRGGRPNGSTWMSQEVRING